MLIVVQDYVLDEKLADGFTHHRHMRQRQWLPRQLLSQPFNVIEIDVGVTKSVHEDPRRQVALLRNHRQE